MIIFVQVIFMLALLTVMLMYIYNDTYIQIMIFEIFKYLRFYTTLKDDLVILTSVVF